jgi:hypothetical protein
MLLLSKKVFFCRNTCLNMSSMWKALYLQHFDEVFFPRSATFLPLRCNAFSFEVQRFFPRSATIFPSRCNVFSFEVQRFSLQVQRLGYL